jgi:hypothetical protein
MRGFNRKRLIPSLAAFAMIAAATLAPLPSFLAAGSVYAHGSHNLVYVESPGRFHNGGFIVVEVEYRCFPFLDAGSTTTAGNITVNAIQSTVTGTGNNNTNVICDGHRREAGVTIQPTVAGTFFDVGRACVTATLTGNTVLSPILAGPTTRSINVEV